MRNNKVKKFAVSACLIVTATIQHSPVLAGGNPKDGAIVFDSICNTCHGDKGETEIPGIPVFAKGERMNKTDEQLKKSIRNGVENPNNPAGMTMPPHGGGPVLTDKQISDVLAYIRTLKKK